MIPESYQPAEWRCTTRKDDKTNRIGVGFNLLTGEIARLSLSVESARHLAESLHQFLSTDQSSNSSGMPSDEVSMPLDGENV